MRAKNKIICMLDCTGCKFWDECTASNEQYIEKIKSDERKQMMTMFQVWMQKVGLYCSIREWEQLKRKVIKR